MNNIIQLPKPKNKPIIEPAYGCSSCDNDKFIINNELNLVCSECGQHLKEMIEGVDFHLGKQ